MKDLPEEEAKGDGGLDGTAPGVLAAHVRGSEEDGEGNGAGEPKDDGDDEQGEGDDSVEQVREVQRRQAQVRQDQ